MAGRIPKEFIQQVLAQTDIASVIQSYVPLKRAGSEYKACCPFHSEKTPSFTVIPAKRFYHCFGCGANGNAISFLMEHANFSYVDAIEDLAQRLGMTVPREGGSPQDPAREQMSEIMERACRYYQQQLKASDVAKDYAKGRGLSGAICKEYAIGYAPAGFQNISKEFSRTYPKKSLVEAGLLTEKDGRTYDRFRNRLIFPIRDFRGRVLGFGARSIDPDDQPKYLNSPETPLFQKRRILYGIHELQQRRAKTEMVVLTEGYMDVVALAQHGVGNALATLGTATTQNHILQLGRLSKKYVFCFDGDRAGRAAGWKALENLFEVFQGAGEFLFAHLPEGEDPDSFVRDHGAERWAEFLKEAMPLEEYFLNHLKESRDMGHATDRMALIEEAKPLLRKINSLVFQELMRNQLEDDLELKRNTIRLHEPGQTAATKTERQATANGSPSTLRKAIRLLLECPELAAEVANLPELPELQMSNLEILAARDPKGGPLLVEMVEFIGEHAGTNVGGIIEHFHDREEQSHLKKLLGWQPLELAAAELEGVFRGILRKIQEEYCKQELEKIRLGRRGKLSPREEERWDALKATLKSLKAGATANAAAAHSVARGRR